MGYIYLASPYSAPTLQVRVNRFMAAQERTIELIKTGHSVYSPIVHWHHISLIAELPTDFEFWKKQNDDLLDGARSIEVLAIDGYKESKGVRYELERARKNDLECSICQPQGHKNAQLLYRLDIRTWTPERVLSKDWTFTGDYGL